MTKLELRVKFVEMVFNISQATGHNKPGPIADILLETAYPKSRIVTKSEDAFQHLRNGLVDAVRGALRSKHQPGDDAPDFSTICDQFKELVGELSSGRYYVPSLRSEEHTSELQSHLHIV